MPCIVYTVYTVTDWPLWNTALKEAHHVFPPSGQVRLKMSGYAFALIQVGGGGGRPVGRRVGYNNDNMTKVGVGGGGGGLVGQEGVTMVTTKRRLRLLFFALQICLLAALSGICSCAVAWVSHSFVCFVITGSLVLFLSHQYFGVLGKHQNAFDWKAGYPRPSGVP